MAANMLDGTPLLFSPNEDRTRLRHLGSFYPVLLRNSHYAEILRWTILTGKPKYAKLVWGILAEGVLDKLSLGTAEKCVMSRRYNLLLWGTDFTLKLKKN